MQLSLMCQMGVLLLPIAFLSGCGGTPMPPSQSKQLAPEAQTDAPAAASGAEVAVTEEVPAATEKAPVASKSTADDAPLQLSEVQAYVAPDPVADAKALRKAKPDVAMSSDDYLAATKKDARSFHAKNAGKVIEVTGPVESYQMMEEDGRGFLNLGPGINVFNCQEPNPMAIAMPGQIVTLRGIVTPQGIVDWSIFSVTGDPPPTISAEQLAKDFAADPAAVRQKYELKYLIVTGVISKLEKDTGARIYLTPRGAKPPVTVYFGSLASHNKSLQVGQTVRVLAQWIYDEPALQMGAVLPLR